MYMISFYNRVFFDPMVKGYYTEEFLELCRKQSIYFDPATEDLETIQHHTGKFPWDQSILP